MELVYLWVEDYKNIHKQGFNFSPRFECIYDEDSNELTIDENKDYMSIFPDYINVTAIVGENGSGKSSLLNILSNLYNVGYIQNNDYSFSIFFIKEEFFLMNNLYRHTTTNKEIKIVLKNNTYKINKVDSFQKGSHDKKPKNQIKQYINKNHFNLSSEIFYKEYLNVSQEFKNHFYFDSFSFFINIELINNKLLTPIELLHSEDESFLKIQNNNLDKESLLYKILNISIYLFIRNKEKYLINDEYNKKIKELYNEIVKSEITCFNDFKKILKIYKKSNLLEKKYYNYFSKKKIEEFFDFFNFEEYEKKLIIEVKNFEKYENVFLKNEISNFLNNLNFIELDMYKKNNKLYNYSSFSDGEKHYFGFLINFYNYNLRNNFQERIILIDELELYLHPKWQKEIFNLILSNLEKNKLKVHLLITSHSPFILSDIPKENVIFLEKYKKDEDRNQKEGNCKIANPDINQTFGANIHTLLSHGFFMDSGLMGEFAKNKINDVYDFLTNLNTQIELTQEKAQKIINLIGEPILKKELQSLYDDKFETNEIDKQIREHQEAINRLKAQRNKND